jgi:tetratricopeptide (TPR) repeat protein
VRVYGSARTRRSLLAIGLVLLGASLLAAALGGPPAWLAGSLVATTIASLAVILRTKTPDDECAFCRSPRSAVKLLVAGPAVAICDACVSLPMAIVAEDFERKKQPYDWHLRFLDSLPRTCPLKVSRALLETIADGNNDPGRLRAAVASSFRLQNNEMVCDLSERIPQSERRCQDWLNLGVGLGNCGRYTEALGATSKALELDDGTSRAWCLSNDAWFHVRLQPDAPVEELTKWLGQVDEAKRLLAERQPPGWRSALPFCHGTEAELRHALGDSAGALKALSEAEKLGPLGGERLLIRARVLASSDGPALGRNDAQSALEQLHPESREAHEARALLARLK